MGNVMVIPARRQVGNTVKQSAQKKLRVAAYCRVSTDSEEQETSPASQSTLKHKTRLLATDSFDSREEPFYPTYYLLLI